MGKVKIAVFSCSTLIFCLLVELAAYYLKAGRQSIGFILAVSAACCFGLSAIMIKISRGALRGIMVFCICVIFSATISHLILVILVLLGVEK